MRRPAAIALLCVGVVPALGGADDRYAGLSGALLACKEYGTVLGTFLTDLRGRDIARLNFLFGEDVAPRFSPDGERILYSSARGGTPGLWVMSREGREPRRICDGDQGDWFPDGRRIAFRREGRIVERPLETGKESILSPVGWRACSLPACSPGGQQVLFLVGGPDSDAIFLAELGAGEPKLLVEGETLCAPRWAPAGDRVAYQSGAHIWVMAADGRDRRQLTTAGGVQRRPAWSPDGAAVAYCQGPGPRGPWRIAVTRADGTRTFPVPPERAHSVLCSDWGAAAPGTRPDREPAKGTSVPAPRLRLWEITQPPTAAPSDWGAFCRERKGWRAVAPGDALPRESRAGYAAENGAATLLLLAGSARALLIPKSGKGIVIGLSLLGAGGKEAKPVASVRAVRLGPDQAVLESAWPSEAGMARVAWTLGGSRALLQVAPLEGARELRISAPLQCVVATDRFGNDTVVDPGTLGDETAPLPWAPVVAGLLGDGSEMLVLVCPEQGQRVGLRKGGGGTLQSADVAFQGRPLAAGFVSSAGAWHLQRFGAEHQADPLKFKWRMPFPATWRLTVQGDGKRYSTLFCDKESDCFDGNGAFFRGSKDLGGNVRLGVIYLYGRVTGTPPEMLTAADLVRDALGLKGAERALDEEGLTSYRTAARPTTWAELSVTVQSLRFLFERRLETQESVYVGHLCDDIPPFVEGMDQRLVEYGSFAREIERQCAAAGAAAPLVEGLAAIARQLSELVARQRGLRAPKELVPVCTKIKQLAASDAGTNRQDFEDRSKELLAVVGPREEILRSCRKLAIELRDAAGSAPLMQGEAAELAERIRRLCQSVLRDRFLAEGDWRGESYDVPAFWLGPRPYE